MPASSANSDASVDLLMDAPFITDDSMADSGTAINLLRQKFPGMFAGASPAPIPPAGPNNPAPVIPASAPAVDPNSIPAPDVGINKFNLPFLPGYKPPQPQRPPISTPTGQWAPGTSKAQKLEGMLRNGLQGAIAGQAGVEQSVVQSGGRTRAGFGTAAAAGLMAPAQQTATQQALQRGGLENQILGTQAQYAPQMQALNFGKVMADIQKNLADAGKATAEEANVLGKEEGDRVPVKLKNTASEIAARGLTTVNTEEGVFERNRITGTNTRLGNNPREISLDTPVGALDSTTGKQVMVTRKDIIGNPGRYAPVSADVSTPVIKQTLKDYASTKPNTAGGQVIAFNTAILHLGLLADAADALGNGNTKLFNSISQKWKEQTGSALPARFDTIKQMASGEITKVGGSLNQGEQEAVKGPLDKSNSPQALKGSIGASVQLMDGKISILHQHYVDVMHEEPDAPLVYPEAQKVRDRLLGGGSSGGTPKFTQVKPGVMVEQ